MKRHIGDRTEQFVEWTPEDMLVLKKTNNLYSLTFLYIVVVQVNGLKVQILN